MNVLLLLLNASKPLTRDEIMKQVNGYVDEKDDSAKRKFERDKDSIRRLIKLDVVQGEDGIEDSYLIDKKATFMPDIQLTDEERVVMYLASKAWDDIFLHNDANAGAIYSAIEYKGPVKAILGSNEVFLAPLYKAVAMKKTVSFEYFSRTSNRITHRVVEPWRLVLHEAHWYLYGQDTSDSKPKLFRLSRIRSKIEITDMSVKSKAPEDVDVAEMFDAYQRTEPVPTIARIRVPVRTCANLRLSCESVFNEGDFDILEFRYVDGYRLARQIAFVADQVQILEPEKLRNEVDIIISKTLESNS